MTPITVKCGKVTKQSYLYVILYLHKFATGMLNWFNFVKGIF